MSKELEISDNQVISMGTEKQSTSSIGDFLSVIPPPASRQSIEISVDGSKNCSLPIVMFCFLLQPNSNVSLSNVPLNKDVMSVLKLFSSMGGKYSYEQRTKELYITQGISFFKIDSDLLSQTRISVLLMSILLIKQGEVCFPTKVGGCLLGDRSFDLHLEAFKRMGCKVTQTACSYEIKWIRRPISSTINFPIATTTGTENVLIFAAFSGQFVTINNAHLKPEILELISFMRKFGLRINCDCKKGIIEVRPKAFSSSKQVNFRIIDDADQALAYSTLGYMCELPLTINFENNYYYKDFQLLSHSVHGNFKRLGNKLHQTPSSNRTRHRHMKLVTGKYPEIGSDSQPVFAALFLKTTNRFTIEDHRFQDRFAYSKYFDRMRISYKKTQNSIEVFPRPPSAINREMKETYMFNAYDLRSGIHALILTAYLKRPVIIRGATILERGYANLYDILDQLNFRYHSYDTPGN